MNTNRNLAASMQGAPWLWRYLPGTIYLQTRLDTTACYGVSNLWEHRREGGNDSAVFCDYMGGNRRQAGERENEEEGFSKEDQKVVILKVENTRYIHIPCSCEGAGGAGRRMYF